MKKSTKGALAAGAAAALLLGGAGSLAYWTSSATTTGGTFSTGSLKLTAGTCTAFKYTPGDGTVTTVVPGDVLYTDCTYTVAATGDHLEATLGAPATVPLTAPASTTTWEATVAATYLLGATAIADGGTVTSADDGETLTAHLVVTVPFGNATDNDFNDIQLKTGSLSDLAVTLTQTQTAANPAA